MRQKMKSQRRLSGVLLCRGSGSSQVAMQKEIGPSQGRAIAARLIGLNREAIALPRKAL